MSYYSTLTLILLIMMPQSLLSASVPEKLAVDHEQVNEWNQFTQRLYELHSLQIKDRDIVKKVSTGGYHNLDDFYREERFYDAKTNVLLSRIQWEAQQADTIHLIEVFVYDATGTLKLDYLSAYLPQARNAPIQTLINIHHKEAQLQAYRQFDASGDRIYEQCKGGFLGNNFFMSLDEDEIPFGEPSFKEALYNDIYPSCFGDLLTEVGELKNPLNARRFGSSGSDTDSTEAPQSVEQLIQSGIERFTEHEFAQSIEYLTMALELDPGNDTALFWRGMAYGRNQQVPLGIADLTVFIANNPQDSRAYTKRGVRYIWTGDLAKAKADLLKAIQLDATNAEAHDDLGVIYAQEKNYQQAMQHFRLSLKYDPSYQKAWHNLSMVHYLTQKNSKALAYVDKSLELMLNKDSLLLKSLIVDALGDRELAAKLKTAANNMEDNNWSETMAIQ